MAETDSFMRFLAAWALVHETADEGWKAAVDRGAEQAQGQMSQGPDAFVDGLSAMIAEEKERLKAALIEGGSEAPGSMTDVSYSPRRAAIRGLGASRTYRDLAGHTGLAGASRRDVGAGGLVSARSRRIAAVFVRAGVRAVWKSRFGMAPARARRQALAVEMRVAFERLGPAFIKLGQLISVRPDLFSPESVFEMEKLQDSVPAVPASAIRKVIESEFGRTAEELFASFDDTPLASASIAQVHRATLRESVRPVFGEAMPEATEVAVKVVRPGVETSILADIAEARRLVSRLGRIRRLQRLNLPGFLDEFAASLISEVDLRNEGRVADRFRFDFRDDELMIVPRVAWPLTTRRVLTTEFVHGWRLSEMSEAERAGVAGYDLAVHGAKVFMRQVLVLGRFHADLHPANLLVTPDSRVCYLDFGIVGRTSPGERIAIAQVLAATVYGDADRALRYSAELGLVVPDDLHPKVRAHVATLLHETMGGSGRPADVKRFAVGFLSMLGDYKIHVPIGYGLLIKALVTVEGVARRIYPEIDITHAAKPFATQLIAQRMLSPERLSQKLPDAVRAGLRELSS